MTCLEFIEFLREKGAAYQVVDNHDHPEVGPQVYVFDKDAYTKVRKHPRKYKDLYVPYLRVSRFETDGDTVYVRDDGYCTWEYEENVKEAVVRRLL